ncbi:hypothetical protein [Promicromonospora sp. NFX87]|uniref:YobI family P-loop NTPase n=1 Tax=Promicromonospora sp. NFX87 TaxID=3402691 RepID=UPI003AFA2C5A
MKTALKDDAVRNIALAGTYGAGKSSVLRELASTHPKRVIEISLLTLGEKDENAAVADDRNPAAVTTTNRIQKEIVKQLLYQQNPSDVPDSRFRRIARFRRVREVGLAMAIGLAALVVMIASGLDATVLPGSEGSTPAPPGWLRTTAGYAAIVAIVATLALTVRLLRQGRLGIEKVTAGPATITLPPRSTSYFDEYLDEIIYFFETHGRRDIVIFEDLDRFNDPSIFEALHSLNGLLNAAKQLKRRDIRFIYAVCDSVFEKLGRDEVSTDDDARDELVRANRTKFFDLIIPIVPFITHKNARDLMRQLLDERGHTISRNLLDVAARHVADMRLIHNVVNEYEVFKNRLIDPPNPVPELDHDRLFAIVLFKNTHAADFEAIRLGTSTLDALHDVWRDLVAKTLTTSRAETVRLQQRIDSQTGLQERAASLGDRLRACIDVLVNAPGTAFVRREIYLGGKAVSDDKIRTPEFWRGLATNDPPVTLSVNRGYNNQHMTLSRDALRTLLGDSLDLDAPAARSTARYATSITSHKERISFLSRRHTWAELVQRPEFTYADDEEGVERTFRAWVEHLSPSRLAADLVIHGYITSYFPLHVSTFYGQLIRPAAMTYIMRNVDQGTADADYPLDPEDVDTLLEEQGKTVLSDRSMYNVSILDHLLQARPEDARVVAGLLAANESAERTFIDHYMGAGGARNELIKQLAPVMPTIFIYLASEAPIEHSARVELFDVALTCRHTKLSYDLNDPVREFVEESYLGLSSLTQPGNEKLSTRAVQLVVDTGAVLPDLTNLSDETCTALAQTLSYQVTAANLQRVARTRNIALDNLRPASVVYEHALTNIADYVDAVDQSPETTFTATSQEVFVEALRGKDAWSRQDFDRFVSRASADCRVDNLRKVPVLAWPALVRELRTPATFENIAAYIEWEGDVDVHLATLLASVEAITGVPDDEAVRQDLATTLINAGSELPDVQGRIDLALSLKPGCLSTDAIEPETGQLIGQLIAEDLIQDDEEAFSSRLMNDWPTLEHAICQSQNFSTFTGPDTLPAGFVAPLMRSTINSNKVKLAVTNCLSKLENVSRDAYQAVADSALRGEYRPSAGFLQQIHQRGASTRSVVELLAKGVGQYTADDLRQVLRSLGKPYSVIADKGWDRPKFADTPAHHTILEHLKTIGIVANLPPKNGMLHVTLRRGTESAG